MGIPRADDAEGQSMGGSEGIFFAGVSLNKVTDNHGTTKKQCRSDVRKALRRQTMKKTDQVQK